MNDKTKIALCLSGEPRSSMFCFPYIYESLINLGPEYEVDVYIHSWRNFRALNLYNPKNYTIDWIDEERFFASFMDYQLDLNVPSILRNIKEFNSHSYSSNSIKNYLLMYLSNKRCFNLINTSYDIYIRSRLDFYLNSPLDIISSINDIKNKKYDVSIPLLLLDNPLKKDVSNLFSDQFAICNLKGAKYYFNIFDNIPNLIEKTEAMNSHVWLKSYLENSNLNIKPSNFFTDLVRSSRVITAYHQPYYDN